MPAAVDLSIVGAISAVPDAAELDVLLASQVHDVAIGGLFHSYFLTNHGIRVVGNQDSDGFSTFKTIVDELAALDEVIDIEAGYTHGCVLQSVGLVKCWDELRASDGLQDVASGLFFAGLAQHVTEIAAGGDSTCAATSAGRVYCWDAHGEHANEPVLLMTGSNLNGPWRGLEGTLSNEYSAFNDHDTKLFHYLDGEAVIYDFEGQWETNKGPNGEVHTLDDSGHYWVGNNSGFPGYVSAFDASPWQACYVTAGGWLYCTDADGVYPNPNSTDPLLENIQSVEVGNGNVCAITNSQLVYCWGQNQLGQFTTVLPTEITTPTWLFL